MGKESSVGELERFVWAIDGVEEVETVLLGRAVGEVVTVRRVAGGEFVSSRRGGCEEAASGCEVGNTVTSGSGSLAGRGRST